MYDDDLDAAGAAGGQDMAGNDTAGHDTAGRGGGLATISPHFRLNSARRLREKAASGQTRPGCTRPGAAPDRRSFALVIPQVRNGSLARGA